MISFTAKKTKEFADFVKDRNNKICTTFTFKDDSQKVKYLAGERKHTVHSNLVILEKYITNFLNTRNSDIDSLYADKDDKESLGSRSFSYHMKPSMIDEFDRSYITISNILQYDIFTSLTDKTLQTLEIKLPKILSNGEVNYGERKKKKEEVEVVELKVEPAIHRIKSTIKDAWDLY